MNTLKELRLVIVALIYVSARTERLQLIQTQRRGAFQENCSNALTLPKWLKWLSMKRGHEDECEHGYGYEQYCEHGVYV